MMEANENREGTSDRLAQFQALESARGLSTIVAMMGTADDGIHYAYMSEAFIVISDVLNDKVIPALEWSES